MYDAPFFDKHWMKYASFPHTNKKWTPHMQYRGMLCHHEGLVDQIRSDQVAIFVIVLPSWSGAVRFIELNLCYQKISRSNTCQGENGVQPIKANFWSFFLLYYFLYYSLVYNTLPITDGRRPSNQSRCDSNSWIRIVNNIWTSWKRCNGISWL